MSDTDSIVKTGIILFDIENPNDFSVSLTNPECWPNLRPYLSSKNQEIPLSFRIKQNPHCVEEYLAIDPHSSKRFQLKFRFQELYEDLPSGSYEMELNYFGTITASGRTLKDFGSTLTSNKILISLPLHD